VLRLPAGKGACWLLGQLRQTDRRQGGVEGRSFRAGARSRRP
jgi:hypothetical protein